MSDRISKPSTFDLYDDFVLGGLKGQHNWIDDADTSEEWASPIIAAPSEDGHPGIIRLDSTIITPGWGYGQMSSGAAVKLRDIAKVGITLKYPLGLDGFATDNGSTFHLWDSVGNSRIGFFTGFGQTDEIRLYESAPSNVTIWRRDLPYSLDEWHTYELRVNYDARLVTFVIDGTVVHTCTPASAKWDTKFFLQIYVDAYEELDPQPYMLVDEAGMKCNETVRSEEAEASETKPLVSGTTRTDNRG